MLIKIILAKEYVEHNAHHGYFPYLTPCWRPPALPSTCVCGTTLCIEHALCCPHGGFTIIRHNEIRDFTADLMKNVCCNVVIEPTLQSLSGELLQPSSAITTDDARLDIPADGF